MEEEGRWKGRTEKKGNGRGVEWAERRGNRKREAGGTGGRGGEKKKVGGRRARGSEGKGEI